MKSNKIFYNNWFYGRARYLLYRMLTAVMYNNNVLYRNPVSTLYAKYKRKIVMKVLNVTVK